MGDEALSIGADTFQFFSRNPRGSGVRKLDVDDIQALNQLMAAHHFAPILAHAPYTLNGCSKTAKTRDFARQAMADDLFAVVASGRVKIHIDQRYPLAEVQQAHRDLEARKTTGSTILTL